MTARDYLAELDAAVAIIDDARHAITGDGHRTTLSMLVAYTEAVLFESEPARLVREWEARHLAALRRVPPTHVAHHESGGVL